MPVSDIDERWMKLALSQGNRGAGKTWPNPSVGCVLVKNNRLIARGYTADHGRPHAECIALNKAGPEAQGSTAYVTLEPCAHHGQTPPCAAALVAAGVERVVVPVLDPDPRVSGKGIETLRSAGIEVETGVLEEAAIQAHRGFFARIVEKRPAVTLKLAMTLDGKIANADGCSRWITGPDARRTVHIMRCKHDAVMVGSGTAISDDPNLLPRIAGIETRPVRIVVDSRLSTPTDGQLARTAANHPVWICHGPEASEAALLQWRALGAELIQCQTVQARVDLRQAMQKFAARGLNRIFCEGGSKFATSLLKSDLIDELIWFHAGILLGSEALAPVGPLALTQFPKQHRFKLCSVKRLGNDSMQRWVRIRS